jgi:hypothetical protein
MNHLRSILVYRMRKQCAFSALGADIAKDLDGGNKRANSKHLLDCLGYNQETGKYAVAYPLLYANDHGDKLKKKSDLIFRNAALIKV